MCQCFLHSEWKTFYRKWIVFVLNWNHCEYCVIIVHTILIDTKISRTLTEHLIQQWVCVACYMLHWVLEKEIKFCICLFVYFCFFFLLLFSLQTNKVNWQLFILYLLFLFKRLLIFFFFFIWLSLCFSVVVVASFLLFLCI